MSLTDAQTAQGMATFHKRSVKAVVQGIGHINALLRRIIKNNKIKWGGYGDEFDWYVRKVDNTASWSNGQLGSRTFEELDPMDKATLAYCYLDATYGIGEASIKTNRAGGIAKIYDIQAENARIAQSSIYRAITAALYSREAGTVATGPAGLRTICGDPYGVNSTSGAVNIVEDHTYAGIYNSSSSAAISAYAVNKASFTNKYWAPEVFDVHECTVGNSTATSRKWSTDGIDCLYFMANAMQRTQDVSGTGKTVKPDLALMDVGPFNALWKLLVAGKLAAGPILLDKDLENVGITNVVVGPVTCVYDENVPTDEAAGNAGAHQMVFVLDSKAFVIETLNTKSEGLVEGEWKTDDPEIVGGVGVYKSNLGLRIDSPVSCGCILGAHD